MLIFCDGMDTYASTAEVLDKWTSVSSSASLVVSASAGRFSGGALTQVGGSVINIVKSISYGTGVAGYGVGAQAYLKTNSWVSAYNIITIGGFALNAQGPTTSRILFPSGAASATFATALYDGNFHNIELNAIAGTGATGSWNVLVDGVSVASATGVTTGVQLGTSLSTYIPAAASSSFVAALDDVIFWDNTGSAFNTFPLGPRKITTGIPSGAGDLTQFTPSTGTNWSCVAGAYGGSAYVSDTSTGNTDLYTFPALPFTPAVVNAVVAWYWGQNPGMGSADLIPKIKTAGTTASGTAQVLANGVNGLYQQTWYSDASGASWTDASVNAMQIGQED